jgi:nucleoside-diphosphate-sugar epimerase
MKIKKSIAILGGTSHIGKNLILYFQKDTQFNLFLFSRDEKKMEKTILENNFDKNLNIKKYEKFNNFKFDAIINCIGISDPLKLLEMDSSLCAEFTEYDDMVLTYLKYHPLTNYIYFSSGAVYGEDFSKPINDLTEIKIPNYDVSPYALCKMKTELKHRKLKNFKIIDVRLFSFFSRYIDINAKFIISEIVKSIQNKKIFFTNDINIRRDYVHPEDLFKFLKICINHNSNCALDIYSQEPISKLNLLEYLKNKFGLKYEINKIDLAKSPTGFKRNYYSESQTATKLGFKPNFSSLETISKELEYLLKTQS